MPPRMIPPALVFGRQVQKCAPHETYTSLAAVSIVLVDMSEDVITPTLRRKGSRAPDQLTANLTPRQTLFGPIRPR
jgi:hypothetical protein